MRLLPFLLILAGVCQLNATGDSLRYLLPTDTVFLYEDRASGHLVFDHYLEPGQSLYSLARHYGLPMDDFYYLNPGLRGSYDPGAVAQVVIPTVAIRPVIPVDSIPYFSQVYWEFKRGESIYGLANRTLKLESDSILYYNNPELDPASMQAGQLIFLGWLPITGIPIDLQPEVIDPYVRRNRGLAQEWERVSAGRRLRTNAGKAAWISEGDANRFLALHRTAPIGSLIEVMDKRTGKVLYCRVLGRIPEQVYDQTVQVVLSPLLVRAFGVRDRFFYVQVKHY